MENNENTTTENTQQETQKQTTNKTNAILKNTCETYKETKPNAYYFSLPSLTLTSFTYKLNEFSKLKLDDNDAKLKEWREVLNDSSDYYTPYSANIDKKENSLFKQGVDVNNELKSISDFKFKKVEGEIKGEIALLKVAKLLGLGDVINIPLPHSGFWVSVKPPTEKDLIDFYTILFREKVILGRATSGLTLSNFAVFVNSKLVDFISRHIHNTSNADIKIEEIGNYILIQDLPILAWGFACSIYSNGFEFSRACINDPTVCTYIAKGTIDPKKLLWIDNSSLSEFQKNTLFENRPNKHNLEVYRKYISEFNVKNKCYIKEGLFKFYFKFPTLNQYFSDGMQWVNKINNSIETVVIDNAENEEQTKQELLTTYVKSSILRQYSHFIDYIELEDSVINDRDTINNILEQISADDDIRKELLNSLNEFINENTIAIIGIPEYKCPNCNKDQNENVSHERFVNVIPLDTINLFFGLITLRIAKATEREI